MSEHGSVIAYLCYENEGESADADSKFRRIGALVYYRSHHEDKPPSLKLRLDLIPASAWKRGIEYFIGNFIPSEKVPEPPFVDGDLFATSEERGKPVICGHLMTKQNESSKKVGEYEDDATQYVVRLFGIPVREWIRIRDADKEKKSIYLRARLEE